MGLNFLFLSVGRYDIRIYPTFLHLHGKTFDYKIPYTTVLRLFLLPHKDQRQMFFVVSEGTQNVKLSFMTRLLVKEDTALIKMENAFYLVHDDDEVVKK